MVGGAAGDVAARHMFMGLGLEATFLRDLLAIIKGLAAPAQGGTAIGTSSSSSSDTECSGIVHTTAGYSFAAGYRISLTVSEAAVVCKVPAGTWQQTACAAHTMYPQGN